MPLTFRGPSGQCPACRGKPVSDGGAAARGPCYQLSQESPASDWSRAVKPCCGPITALSDALPWRAHLSSTMVNTGIFHHSMNFVRVALYGTYSLESHSHGIWLWLVRLLGSGLGVGGATGVRCEGARGAIARWRDRWGWDGGGWVAKWLGRLGAGVGQLRGS